MPEEHGDHDRNQEDEDAVWAQLIASFDKEPAEGRSWPDAEDLDDEASEPGDQQTGPASEGDVNTRSMVVLSGPLSFPETPGPRDYSPEDEDEGHYEPPPPPPLPQVDTTTKFAWVGALGGPLLLIVMVVLQQTLTWWMVMLGVGGFLGGFGTLIARMKDHDDDDEDPTGGAVV